MTSTFSSGTNDRREVIVTVDGPDDHDRGAAASMMNNQIRREPSITFWKDLDKMSNDDIDKMSNDMGSPGVENNEDPPSKLIGQFLNRQRAAGVGMSLDADLQQEMDELHQVRCSNPTNLSIHPDARNYQTHNHEVDNDNANNAHLVSTKSKELKATFFQALALNHSNQVEEKELIESSSEEDEDESSAEDHPAIQELHNRRTSNADGVNNMNGTADAQVLRCTSTQFQRRTSCVLGRSKTKSRLLDRSPERVSGMLGKHPPPPDDEEDDPLFDEDLPDDFRKSKLNALTLAQWVSLFLIVSALICTIAISKWKRMNLRGLRLWKWEVLVLVLICGRLVSGWGIRIVVLLIERNFLLRKRVLYFVYGIRKAVQNCIWLGLVLLAWHYIFDKKVAGNNDFLRYVNKVMVCMLVATLLWLVKTLMVKVLASSFHVSTFFDRIQESLFNQYVIKVLSGPPVIEIKTIQEEEEDRMMAEEVHNFRNAGATLPPDLRPQGQSAKSGGVMKASIGIKIDRLHRLNPKNVSAWNMKMLMNMVRHGVLSTLDEQIMDTNIHDESATHITSEFEAKVAARKIFRNVAKPRAKFIYLEDLRRFLLEEEALKTMNIVEGSSESEKFSKASLKNWVVNAFRERRALALTLNDTKTAVNKLRQMVNVIVGIIIVIVCLVILGIASSKLLLFISSQIVVVAFVFGNTCKTIFEAIIFLFVMHPFDVGDRCEIDGVQMIVEEMNILTTVFLRFDNQKISYPNSTLSTKPIHNYYRSPDMGDTVEFFVHIATPAEKISIMKQRIISYIESKKDHWHSSPTVVLMNLEDLNRLKMSVWVRHKMNHQDMGTRWQRRALLVEEMIKIFKELDIDFRLYPLDINVRSLPSSSFCPTCAY